MFHRISHISNDQGVASFDLLDELDASEVLAPDCRARRRTGRVVLRQIAQLQSRQLCSILVPESGFVAPEALILLLVGGLAALTLLSHEIGWLVHQVVGGISGGVL